ncbi:MAG: ABC transporter ATP-binding protein, partial [Actinomycetota bacterium]
MTDHVADVADVAGAAAHDESLPTATGPEARARLVRLIRDRARRVVVLLVLAVAAIGVQLLGPALVGVSVDAVADAIGGDRTVDDARSTITTAAVLYGLAAIVGAVLTWFGTVQAATIGESALAELRTEVFDHALGVDVDRIERGGTGDLVARLTGDVEVLGTAVQRTVPSVLLATVEIVLTVVALVIVDVRLAVVAILAGIPATVIGLRWYARHAPGRYRVEREAQAALSTQLFEGYSGRSTLATFSASSGWRRRAVRAGDGVLSANLSTAAARNRLRPSIRVGLACSLVAVIAVGSALVDDGGSGSGLGIGVVSAVALYVVRLFEPIGRILEELDEIQQATAAAARLVGVTQVDDAAVAVGEMAPVSSGSSGRAHAPSSAPARAAPAPPGPAPTAASSVGPSSAASATSVASAMSGLSPAVRLVGVSFGYGDRTVVHELDLSIPVGQRVAVVGASGAGKSTLAKLMVGFHHPDTGTIERGVDGVVLVTQESHAFERSVRDNVTLGRPDATDEEVWRSLEVVTAREWVERLAGEGDVAADRPGDGAVPPRSGVS